ncbi:hypothetical protein BJV77DRAFT_996908 [Russula vinacea]|nr:hypothetical protein BJV77DRAFT_996908 [Russula vinacea]
MMSYHDHETGVFLRGCDVIDTVYKTPSQRRLGRGLSPITYSINIHFAMFDAPLVALLTFLSIIDWASAQVNAPPCTISNFSWSFNSLEQSPCLVAAHLFAQCNNGSFTILPLLPQNTYAGPSVGDDGDLCKCGTVGYNLISACDACQGEPWIPYPSWSANCTTIPPTGTFPEPIPVGVRVPNWAYLDIPASSYWNATEAQLTGDSPEVTGSASVSPSLVGGGTTTTSKTSSSPVPSAFRGSSNTGAIAGGVVGGIIGVALITGFAAWFTIRRRRARSPRPPSVDYFGGQESEMGVVPYPPNIGRKLYDPSDPSTYPTTVPSPTINATESSRQYFSSSSDLHPNRKAYTGLPEI